jgi:hypothetical protein
MPDEPRDELGNIEDALFGGGDAPPPPPSGPAATPADDLDWIDEGLDAGFPELPPLSPEDDDALFFGPRDDLEPITTPAPVAGSDPETEGPIVDAAIFGTTAGAAGATTPTRRELHARPDPRDSRRRRLVAALVVAGLVLLVGAGVAAVASGGDSGGDTQVKVVGTDLPSTTVTTRPATTAPATVAPTTVAPTEPPTTARPAGNVTPARPSPPVVQTDPPPPPPVVTDPPPPPPTTSPPTTTTVAKGCSNPNDPNTCVG